MYRRNNISQLEANKILDMSDDELRSNIQVSDGKKRCSTLQGIEIEVGWDNPEGAIIHHFWIDSKLRGNGIGTIMCEELITQLKQISRLKFIHTSISKSGGSTKYVLKKCGFDDIVEHNQGSTDSKVIEGRLRL